MRRRMLRKNLFMGFLVLILAAVSILSGDGSLVSESNGGDYSRLEKLGNSID